MDNQSNIIIKHRVQSQNKDGEYFTRNRTEIKSLNWTPLTISFCLLSILLLVAAELFYHEPLWEKNLQVTIDMQKNF
jgi:hypothetical protein